MPKYTSGYRKIKTHLLLLFCGLFLCITLLAGWVLQREYAQIQRTFERNIANHNFLLKEGLRGVLDSVETALHQVGDDWLRDRYFAVRTQEQAVRDSLAVVSRTPYLRDIVLLDNSGNVTGGTLQKERMRNFSDKLAFSVHFQQTLTRMFVGIAPNESATGDNLVFSIKIRNMNHATEGIALAYVDTKYFQRVFTALSGENNIKALLLHQNGSLVAASSNYADSRRNASIVLAETPLFAQVQEKGGGAKGLLFGDLLGDGRENFAVVSKLKLSGLFDHDLAIVSLLPRVEVFSEYYRLVNVFLFFWAGVMFVGGALMLVLFRQMDRRSDAEKEVQTISKRFERVAQASSDIIWETDAEGVVVYVSESGANAGFFDPPLLGSRLAERFQDVEDEKEVVMFHRLLVRGVSFRDKQVCLHREDEDVYFSVSAMPIRDEHGRFTGFTGSLTNITAELAGERENLRSILQYRKMFDVAGVSLWDEDIHDLTLELRRITAEVPDFRAYLRDNPGEVWRLAGMIKILDVNDYTVKLYRAKSKSDLFGSLEKTVGQEYGHIMAEALIALAAGEQFFETEAVQYTVDGRKLHVHLRTATFSDGTVPWLNRTIVSISDMTERAAMEAQLVELNHRLEDRVVKELDIRRQQEQYIISQAKFASMGQMMSAIAHQWRQPLNTLGLYVQDVADAFEAGEVDTAYLNDFSSRAMKQILFMSRTIDDFRDFFRPDKEMVTFSVCDAVAEVISLVCAQLENFGITYQLQFRDEEKDIVLENPEDIRGNEHQVFVKGFPNEFKQVMLNLVHNARDAMVKKRGQIPTMRPRLHILLESDSNRVRISVADNGGGIPDAIADRVFDPYFTTKDDGGGTGIGLYMSRMIIEKSMRGDLHFYNSSEGAVFVIDIARKEFGM